MHMSEKKFLTVLPLNFGCLSVGQFDIYKATTLKQWRNTREHRCRFGDVFQHLVESDEIKLSQAFDLRYVGCLGTNADRVADMIDECRVRVDPNALPTRLLHSKRKNPKTGTDV